MSSSFVSSVFKNSNATPIKSESDLEKYILSHFPKGFNHEKLFTSVLDYVRTASQITEKEKNASSCSFLKESLPPTFESIVPQPVEPQMADFYPAEMTAKITRLNEILEWGRQPEAPLQACIARRAAALERAGYLAPRPGPSAAVAPIEANRNVGGGADGADDDDTATLVAPNDALDADAATLFGGGDDRVATLPNQGQITRARAEEVARLMWVSDLGMQRRARGRHALHMAEARYDLEELVRTREKVARPKYKEAHRTFEKAHKEWVRCKEERYPEMLRRVKEGWNGL